MRLSEEKRLEVSIRFGDSEAKFSGSINEVTSGILAFLGKVYPAYEIISRLTLTADLEQLLRALEGIIAVTPEGLVIVIQRERLTDRDAIILHLVKAYVGHQLKKMDRPSLSIAEIISLIGGKPGAVAGRLSELTDEGWVMRLGRGEYQITTLGIKLFLEGVIPKLKS